MTKKEKKTAVPAQEENVQAAETEHNGAPVQPEAECVKEPVPPEAECAKEATPPEAEQGEAALAKVQAELAKEKENYLRLAAEYDNFRKRSQKEKDGIYTDAKAETVARFLPVFDNLERAAAQQTTDEAYKKGVEMTLGGLREVMKALGVEEFGEAGEPFDPNRHNAVMHTHDETLGENVVTQVFAKGFRVGERVVRFAMVQVAN